MTLLSKSRGLICSSASLTDSMLNAYPPNSGSTDTYLGEFGQTRTLRIGQMDGLELSTDKRDLAAPGRYDLTLK